MWCLYFDFKTALLRRIVWLDLGCYTVLTTFLCWVQKVCVPAFAHFWTRGCSLSLVLFPPPETPSFPLTHFLLQARPLRLQAQPASWSSSCLLAWQGVWTLSQTQSLRELCRRPAWENAMQELQRYLIGDLSVLSLSGPAMGHVLRLAIYCFSK